MSVLTALPALTMVDAIAFDVFDDDLSFLVLVEPTDVLRDRLRSALPAVAFGCFTVPLAPGTVARLVDLSGPAGLGTEELAERLRETGTCARVRVVGPFEAPQADTVDHFGRLWLTSERERTTTAMFLSLDADGLSLVVEISHPNRPVVRATRLGRR